MTQGTRRRLVIGRAIISVVVLTLSLAACYGFDPLYTGANGPPPPVVPAYPQRQQVQERVIRRPWRTEWVTTFRTTDSPAQLEAFYQRELSSTRVERPPGSSGGRWYSAKGLGYPDYQANPLLWMYDEDYCPTTAMELSWTSDQPGITDVRVRVNEGYCGYFPIGIARHVIGRALGR